MKKIITSIIIIFTALVVFVAPAYAEGEKKCVMTSVLGKSACRIDGNETVFSHDIDAGNPLQSDEVNCSCDDGNGSSISELLQLVVSIMTIGVGILGVIGITLVGIQYLTAGGNEEQTKKAKRRLLEIIIGIVAYVLIFSILSWLIPDFEPFSW